MIDNEDKEQTRDRENHPDTQSDSAHLTSTTAGLDGSDAANASSSSHSDSSDQRSLGTTRLPDSVFEDIDIILGSDGHTYLVITDDGNAHTLRIGTKQANLFIRHLARQKGIPLKSSDLREINDELTANAELSCEPRDIRYRVAPQQGGIELDMGDAYHTRIRILPDKVEIIKDGSATLFSRTLGMQPFMAPAETGELKLLEKYLNLDAVSRTLLVAWIGYTLAHPKTPTTSYLILVLQGDQGSGKSFLCKIIQALVDPSMVGVQSFPTNPKDLVIACQNAHVLFYDNLRAIKPHMADKLCMASTGGALTTRRLYTDAEQQVLPLHGAIVLNGIHSFVDQPDLAQRCMPLHLKSIDEKNRRSESELYRDYQSDLPQIFRGLLDLTAGVLAALPSVEVSNPERMIDFVRWLAAMEKVHGAPPGIYQSAYGDALNHSMLESLLENPLAAAVLLFADDKVDDFWTGTPTDLLRELEARVGKRTPYSRDWPQNPISLSKRLRSLRSALRRQGIDVELSRGKQRKITIERMEGAAHD